MGRGLSPPPRPEKRRRGGAKPAQTARGRGGAARRGRARRPRAGAGAGRTGLFGVPRRSWSGRSLAAQASLAVAADLQAPLDSAKGGGTRGRAGGGGRARPARAGRCGRRGGAVVTALRADAEPLAIFCADATLAKALNWPVPAPLLAGELFARRATGEGRRPHPGEAGWLKLVALSYAARRSPPSTWPRTCRAALAGSPTPRQNCGPRGRGARSRPCSP